MENKMIDLTTPRYLVVAAVPFSKFMVGDILLQHRHKVFGVDYTWFSVERYSQCINANVIFDYPHLFRPLAWYEKRDIKDMPEYVKDKEIDNLMYKVRAFSPPGSTFVNQDGIPCPTDCFLPATATEYDNYIKQKI